MSRRYLDLIDLPPLHPRAGQERAAHAAGTGGHALSPCLWAVERPRLCGYLIVPPAPRPDVRRNRRVVAALASAARLYLTHWWLP